MARAKWGVTAGAVLCAGLTLWLPVLVVVLLLAAADLGLLFYWFYVRPGPGARAVQGGPLTPMRTLARVLRAAGVVLIANALWLTLLGYVTEFGITDETTANWGGLAALGLQVDATHPSQFGARCIVVAAAVWAVGFGLAKASGENA